MLHVAHAALLRWVVIAGWRLVLSQIPSKLISHPSPFAGKGTVEQVFEAEKTARESSAARQQRGEQLVALLQAHGLQLQLYQCHQVASIQRHLQGKALLTDAQLVAAARAYTQAEQEAHQQRQVQLDRSMRESTMKRLLTDAGLHSFYACACGGRGRLARPALCLLGGNGLPAACSCGSACCVQPSAAAAVAAAAFCLTCRRDVPPCPRPAVTVPAVANYVATGEAGLLSSLRAEVQPTEQLFECLPGSAVLVLCLLPPLLPLAALVD